MLKDCAFVIYACAISEQLFSGSSAILKLLCLLSGQEPMSSSMQLHYIPVTASSQTDLFLDRISRKRDSPGSAMTNHGKLIDVTGPELPFFHERKGILKVDQSVKMPWHRLCMRVECSYSLAPALVQYWYKIQWDTVIETRDRCIAICCWRSQRILSHKSNALLAAQMLAKPSISEKFR